MCVCVCGFEVETERQKGGIMCMIDNQRVGKVRVQGVEEQGKE